MKFNVDEFYGLLRQISEKGSVSGVASDEKADNQGASLKRARFGAGL